MVVVFVVVVVVGGLRVKGKVYILSGICQGSKM